MNDIIRVVNSKIRKSFYVYVLLRKFARFACKFLILEEGFDILKYVTPRNKSVALDIGSNDGTSVSMIRQLQKNVQILCFDPIYMLKNLDHGVLFFKYGLSDSQRDFPVYSPKVGKYSLSQYSSVSKMHILENLHKDFDLKSNQIIFHEHIVQLKILDELNICPFFIKIDVEGHEFEVLQGAQNTIRLYHPIILVEIQNVAQYNRIAGFLDNLNYFNLMWPQASNKKVWVKEMRFQDTLNNYIFVPRGYPKTWEFR